MVTREQALPYVSFCVDDALTIHEQWDPATIPANARLVGWQCGFEPLVVAVWSYLDVRLEAEEAEDLAADALEERKWFADGRTPADFVV